MEREEFSFNAISAGQFATELDQLMEFARNRAVSQASPLTTSEGVISANALLIPIQAVQELLQEAHKLGQGSQGAIEIPADSNEGFKLGLEKGYKQGYDEGFNEGHKKGRQTVQA